MIRWLFETDDSVCKFKISWKNVKIDRKLFMFILNKKYSVPNQWNIFVLEQVNTGPRSKLRMFPNFLKVTSDLSFLIMTLLVNEFS